MRVNENVAPFYSEFLFLLDELNTMSIARYELTPVLDKDDDDNHPSENRTISASERKLADLVRHFEKVNDRGNEELLRFLASKSIPHDVLNILHNDLISRNKP